MIGIRDGKPNEEQLIFSYMYISDFVCMTVCQLISL